MHAALACLALVSAAGCRRAQAPAAVPAVPQVEGTLALDGLSAPVRVVRDRWGVPHITAANTEDLFVAQGFVQAQDRLFQMDLWRRAGQGRLAEVLGSNFIGRDAMTRRIQYRGNPDEEWAVLGGETRAIATAFVRGINAWVAVARAHPPESFVLAGWRPDFWRPDDLLNRTDAFLASSGASEEVFRARLVAAVGVARAGALLGAPVRLPSGVDPRTITYQMADALRQIGAAPFFVGLAAPVAAVPFATPGAVGSNAWAVAGRRSATGAPVVAVDPHRPLTNPSTRYLVHLSAPGWNVAGATAPWLPGVTMGHNDRVAWGMASFAADTQDLAVERLNPNNPHQVEVNGQWTNTTVVMDPIWVKGRTPVTFEREYTPHGVVIAVDSERHLAFTLRWSGLDAGADGELAALALDRATSAADARSALEQWKTPAVEVVFADVDGAIGSQVAARVPVRHDGDGQLPTAGWRGEGRWDGWRARDTLPRAATPAAGYVASANHNRAREARLRDVLTTADGLTVEDTRRLQQDVLAWNAERLVPLFASLRAPRDDVDLARQRLLAWNRRVSTDSTEASLYVAWEGYARRMLVERRVPSDLVEEFVTRAGDAFVPAMTAPASDWFDGDVRRTRNALMLRALTTAVDALKARAGDVERGPAWGQLHAATFAHPLAVTDAARRRFTVGPFPRPGYADTLLSTSGRGFEAAVGASFSAVFDLSRWDASIAENAPGQSEYPASAHFADLARLWSTGQSFPLVFSDAAVRANAETTLTLVPR